MRREDILMINRLLENEIMVDFNGALGMVYGLYQWCFMNGIWLILIVFY